MRDSNSLSSGKEESLHALEAVFEAEKDTVWYADGLSGCRCAQHMISDMKNLHNTCFWCRYPILPARLHHADTLCGTNHHFRQFLPRPKVREERGAAVLLEVSMLNTKNALAIEKFLQRPSNS